MDKALFVENVKKLCLLQGIKPTIACRESGAGVNLLNQLEGRGSIPSVEKVQMLAAYLGVTTSQLLGETPVAAAADLVPDELELVLAYRAADVDDRAVVDAALRKYKKAPARRAGGKTG